MKERPILMSGPLVRALLDKDNPKTQTRRPIKVRAVDIDIGPPLDVECPFGEVGDKLWCRETWAPYHDVDLPVRDLDAATCARYAADDSVYLCEGSPQRMPVKLDSYALAPHHKMPGGPWKWRPSIHMPRWASRMTLTLTDVRVQRVQDISEEDARAEGFDPAPVHGEWAGPREAGGHWSARKPFADAWTAIYGEGAWARNDWVWALTFTTEVRS